MDDMIALVDAARYLGVRDTTLRGWVKSGQVAGAAQMGARGTWLIPRSEVERLREEREAGSHQKASDWTPMIEREGRYT
jgi:excisionase family DNA binding protein